ncbi:MAG: hypothetical protein ACOCXG_02565 [Nanoarchaeota archaeon]
MIQEQKILLTSLNSFINKTVFKRIMCDDVIDEFRDKIDSYEKNQSL